MKKLHLILLIVSSCVLAASMVGCGTVGSRNPKFTKLAFYSNRTANPATNLFVMNVDGSNVTPVPTGSGNLYTPMVSADSKTVAYTLDGHVWTSNVDGSAPHQLTANDFYVYAVKLSPDGKKILFNESNSGTSVWIMNVDGTSPLNLTSTMPAGMTWCYGGSFSADSAKIAINCQGSTLYGIYTVKPDGTALTIVNNLTDYTDTPVFTPDGKKILFALYNQNTDSGASIFSVNLDGSNQTAVATNGYEVEVLNSTLYYSVYDSTLGHTSIYKSNLDGSNAVALTDGSSYDYIGTATY